jgi:hypothetical protein
LMVLLMVLMNLALLLHKALLLFINKPLAFVEISGK